MLNFGSVCLLPSQGDQRRVCESKSDFNQNFFSQFANFVMDFSIKTLENLENNDSWFLTKFM